MSYGSDVLNIFNLFSSKGPILNLACYGGDLGFEVHTKNEIMKGTTPMTIHVVRIYSSFNNFNPPPPTPHPKFTYGSMLKHCPAVMAIDDWQKKNQTIKDKN